eukprot:5835377-Amphidinium_carterae.1
MEILNTMNCPTICMQLRVSFKALSTHQKQHKLTTANPTLARFTCATLSFRYLLCRATFT